MSAVTDSSGAYLPGAASAPVTTGSTPSVVANAPIPNSGVYGAQKAAAQQAYDNAMHSISTKRLSALQKYGFLADVDPVTGKMANVHVDPNNPFGQYQQMSRSEAQSSDDLLAREQGRGFTGGLVNRDLTADDYNVGLERSNFGRGMESEMSDYDQALLEAGTSRDTSFANIDWQAAQDALAAQAFTPTDYGASVETPTPAAAPAVRRVTATQTSAARRLAASTVRNRRRRR